MARKGREPLVEAPPPAASSSEEEESEEEEDDPEENPNHSSSGEESEEEEEDLEQPPSQNHPSTLLTQPPSSKKGPTQKKPEPAMPTKPESDSGSDSESDTDSDSPPAKVKPISSKPMENNDTPKPKPSRSKPPSSTATVTVAALASTTPTTAGKRPVAGTEPEKGIAKKAKKEKSASVGSPSPSTTVATPAPIQDEGKKQLFQRLWSAEDEIVLLKGMIDYKAKKGADPLENGDDFLDFIKESLHVVDVNKAQMVNKVKRQKKKYENAKKKKISNPHERSVFELSKKIWGSSDDNNNGDVVVENGNSELKLSTIRSKAKASAGGGSISNSNAGEGVNERAFVDGKRKRDEDENEDDIGKLVSRWDREVVLGNGVKFGLFSEGVMKEGLGNISEEKRADLVQKWRKHNVMEMELFLKRLDLLRETTQTALDAAKSANH